MDKSNRIALWLNDRREKASHPHLKGQGETNTPVWASAWFSDEISDEDKRTLQAILKRYDSKKPFISISLQEKENKRESSPPPKDEFQDDKIPF